MRRNGVRGTGADEAGPGLAGPTRVLLPDGSTRPIARLRVGDVVLGTELVEGIRRYVPTAVLAHGSARRPAYAVRSADGTEIVASGEHRFLTDSGWRHVSAGWCRAGRRPHLRPESVLLGPGSLGPVLPRAGAGRPHTPGYRRGYLCGVVRGDGPGFPSERLELEALGRTHHLLAVARAAHGGATEPGRIAPGVLAPAAAVAAWPEGAGDEWCAGFLAGLIDACGSVARGELGIEHHEEEIVGRAAGALHRLGFRFTVEAGRPGMRVVRALGGPAATRRLLALTDPAVTRRRRIDGGVVGGGSGRRVAEVRALGREEAMVTVVTGTGDVVAEGVVTHDLPPGPARHRRPAACARSELVFD